MATTKPYPGKYRVTNNGKRTRVRAGTVFPGTKPGEKPEPVEVHVRTRGEYLQIKGCKFFDVKPVRGGSEKS